MAPKKQASRGRGARKKTPSAPAAKPPKVPKSPKGSQAASRTSPRKAAAEKPTKEADEVPGTEAATTAADAAQAHLVVDADDAAVVGDDSSGDDGDKSGGGDEEPREALPTRPTTTVGKGRGNKGKGKAPGAQKEKKARQSFTLTDEHEAIMFEWLRENECLWKRGHKKFKDTKKKEALWDEHAERLGYTRAHLQGWWRGMHTWYVKLHKLKSGQAVKEHTDREKDILRECAFYESQVKHRHSQPMKSISLSSGPPPSLPVPQVLTDGSASEDESRPASPPPSLVRLSSNLEDDDDNVLTRIESSAAHSRSQATPTPSTGTPTTSSGKRGTKRSREESKDIDYLIAINQSMKYNNELLQRLVDEKPKSSRDTFIRYVGDTLRDMSAEEYKTVKTKIACLLTDDRTSAATSGSEDMPSIAARTTTRPTASRSAPLASTQDQQFSQQQQFGQQYGQQNQFWPGQFDQSQQQYSQQQHFGQQQQYPQAQQYQQSTSPQYRGAQPFMPQTTATVTSTATATVSSSRASAEISGILNQTTQVLADTSMASMGSIDFGNMSLPANLSVTSLASRDAMDTPPHQAPASKSPAASASSSSATTHVLVSARKDTQEKIDIFEDIQKTAEDMGKKDKDSDV